MSEEKKKEQTIQEAVAAAIQEALPVATALAAKALQGAQQPAAKPVDFLKTSPLTCNECGQYVKACKGEHRMTCVFPVNPEYGEWFTGVRINSVKYISNGPGHMISVPRDCNVEYLVSEWEANEKRQRFGRKINHNSGSVGGTNNFNAFNGAGFGEGQ